MGSATMTDTEQELEAAEHACLTCEGIGEIVECPPTCDGSHREDMPYVCRDCDGTGSR